MEDHSSSVAKDVPGGQVAPIAELQALLARVEAATGPDRELDALIECAARWQQGLATGLSPQHIAIWRPMRGLPGEVESQGTRYAAEPFTASLDAALALVERVIGIGWFDVGGPTRHPGARATIARIGSRPWVEAKTPALALCAALLAALIAKAASPTRRRCVDGRP